MCGFLGEFSFNGHPISDSSSFEKLLLLSKHRGPDDTQWHTADNYQLGFNRLAVIDLTDKGKQPKQSPSKRYTVVFNGELYNFKTLAKAFELGLDPTSDTEVLTVLLDAIGVEKTIDNLNGMFAIMILDNQTNTCYLTRDFVGIKPLFYGVSDRGLVAASQFNQVFKHQWFASNLMFREDCIRDYFSLGHMVAPTTVFKNIFQVKPGEIIKVQVNGTLEYYNGTPMFDKSAINKDNSGIPKLYNVLSMAVKDQMISDVPLGTFLSGGIDSPIITAMAHQHNGELEAFTLAVKDENLDESSQAKGYADHLHCHQHIVEVDENSILQVVDEHFSYMSQPFGDYSSIPTFLISKLAKRRNTVMLSGDGGDELFFGYPRILKIYKLRYWFKIPMFIRKPIVRLCIKLGLLKSWGPFSNTSIGAYILHRQAYISNDSMAKIMPNISYSESVRQLFDVDNHLPGKTLLQRLRYNELYCHLQRVLTKVDLMSMGNSLEVRVPFLDKRIIIEALSWLPKMYSQPSDLKLPLKEIMRKIYPKSIINTNKKGFAVPIDNWLKGPLKADVYTSIFDTAFYGGHCFNMEELRRFVNDFFDEKHNDAWGIWHIYTWQKWAIKQDLI